MPFTKTDRTEMEIKYGKLHRMTLDITLFYLIARNATLEKAAADQHIELSTLKSFIEQHKQTPQYKRLIAYYTEERLRRNAVNPHKGHEEKKSGNKKLYNR